MNVIHMEKSEGVIVSLGGQTAINLASDLEKLGVNIIGTNVEAIENVENLDKFEKIMHVLEIPEPSGQAVTNIEDGVKVANEIGYPVLVDKYIIGKELEIDAICDGKHVIIVIKVNMICINKEFKGFQKNKLSMYYLERIINYRNLCK